MEKCSNADFENPVPTIVIFKVDRADCSYSTRVDRHITARNGVSKARTNLTERPYLETVDDRQFKELMKRLKDIATKLEEIESAVSGVESAVSMLESSQTSAWDLGDVVRALDEVKEAIDQTK